MPELNEAVAAYAEHERSVIDAAAQARERGASATSPPQRAGEEQRLGAAIGGVVGIAEANPELKASERFAQLSEQLSKSEDRIALARMVYNDTVQTYNAAIEQLPASLVAGALGFRRRALFELRGRPPVRRCAWLVLALARDARGARLGARGQELHGLAGGRQRHARAQRRGARCART